jgi:hypothetical protein
MRSFYGSGKRRSYFEGWYFKQQSDTDTIAFISAFHIDGAGRASASVQVITRDAAYHVPFSANDFEADENRLRVKIGSSVFSEKGCKLNIAAESLTLEGILSFGPFAPVRGDIMGPFRAAPFMQCRHRVFSMCHAVNGTVDLNGRQIEFKNAAGYLEGDRGSSFPKRYVWMQSFCGDASIMLSVAEVPYFGVHFTGCIGFVYVNGTEYRIATYRGAKLKHISDKGIDIEQGDMAIQVRLLSGAPHCLRAPASGRMLRLIHESACCRVSCSVKINGRELMNCEDEQASFECNWHE